MALGRPTPPPSPDAPPPVRPLPAALLDEARGGREPPRLAPPPRALPLEIHLHLLFGAREARAGWGLVLLGLLVVVAMGPHTDLAAVGAVLGERAVAPGLVLEVGETDWTEGEIDLVPVTANRFRFTAPDGQEIEGLSYCRGRCVAPGRAVEVEYAVSDPFRARIRGQRYRPFGLAGLALPLPVLAGLGLAALAARDGRRRIRLLERGVAGLGRVIGREEIPSRRSPPRVRLHLAFTTVHGREARVTLLPADLAASTDDDLEILLYDPHRPEDAALLDDLPGRPAIAPGGGFADTAPVGAWISLLLPVVSLGVALAAVWHLWAVAG